MEGMLVFLDSVTELIVILGFFSTYVYQLSILNPVTEGCSTKRKVSLDSVTGLLACFFQLGSLDPLKEKVYYSLLGSMQ